MYNLEKADEENDKPKVQNLARSVAYSEGEYPDIIPTGINLMSNDVTASDIEALYNEISFHPVSNPVYTIEDVYDILEKTENSFYWLNDTERKLLEAALKNRSTPMMVASRIKAVLEKEPAQITEAGTDVPAESTPAQQNHPTKKVIADVLNIRSMPGLNGQKNGNLTYGQEVIVDADSAVTVDGYTWVKIVSGDKVGWIATEYLEDIEPEEQTAPDNSSVDDESEGNNEFSGIDAFSEFSENSKNERRFTNDVLKPRTNPKVVDPETIQEEFNEIGDFDKVYGLECPDLPNWYITTHTNLTFGGGNGREVVSKLVAANDNLSEGDIITDPAQVRIPSVFSVQAGVKELGANGSQWGHTGIIVGINEENKTFLIIHTWDNLEYEDVKSSIKEYPIPQGGVKYLNLDKFIE